MLKPLSEGKWNYATAAHLLNRAGFGGPPAEIQKLADLNPDQAVALLLDYEKIPDPTPNPDWAKPDPERMPKCATSSARHAGGKKDGAAGGTATASASG